MIGKPEIRSLHFYFISKPKKKDVVVKEKKLVSIEISKETKEKELFEGFIGDELLLDEEASSLQIENVLKYFHLDDEKDVK